MENAVKTRLQSLHFGEVQTFKNITIVPLIAPADGIFQYRTLGEALAPGDLAITEISDAGSVPELMVVNRGKTPVLLIDGEELAGAKQNRVFNTSILLKENSETKIPVSCTEQGRWSYASKAFSESGNVMAYKSRSRKTSSVHASLEASGAYGSDQHEVWDGIAALHAKAGSQSPTSAMNDVFKAREADLRNCDEIFKPMANQVGLLTLIGGVPAGMDIVSLASAYAKIHSKLVRSYTLEGLLDSRQEAPGAEEITSRARKFLDEITTAEERPYPPVGHGTDYRYRSQPPAAPKVGPGGATINPQSPTICGTALVHENEVIHAAFFRLEDREQSDTLSSLRIRRRDYRTERAP